MLSVTRQSIVDVHTCGIGGIWQTYDAERVGKRAEMIGYAIAARHARYPDEPAFVYRPHAEAGRQFFWDDAARDAIRNYDKLDMFI